MKNKGLLALMLIGMIVVIVGSLFKIMHWPGSTVILIAGLAAEAVALALLVVRSLNAPSLKKNNTL